MSEENKLMWCPYTFKYERYWIESNFPNGMGGGNRLHYIDKDGKEISWFDMRSPDEVVEKPKCYYDPHLNKMVYDKD